MRSIIFGEVIWDVYPDKKTIGGAPFNFSANIALLGDEAYLVTAVGNDELGKSALVHMKNFDIKTDFVLKNNYPTGQCTVTLDKNRIPSYVVHENTAYDNIEITDNMIQKIKDKHADVFYFNTLIQRNTVSRMALIKILNKCSFKEIFCDINIREGCYDKDSIKLCMKNANTLKISDEEMHYLYDTGILDANCTSLKDICNKYPNIKTIVFTKGGAGSEVYDAQEDKLYASKNVPKVEVISSVGAGDCYGATYLNSIYKGDSIQQAIQKATQRSAKVVASYEAIVK